MWLGRRWRRSSRNDGRGSAPPDGTLSRRAAQVMRRAGRRVGGTGVASLAGRRRPRLRQ